VIVGLLIGGVLKGQELIENTKIKSVVNEVNAYQAAIFGYQDRYNALPGDDAGADRFANVTNAQIGNGNGTLDAAERGFFYLHLAEAGFVKGFEGMGDTTTSYPTHKYSGQIQPLANTATFRLAMCYTALTLETAEALERAVDGTVDPASGNVRRSNQAAYAATNNTVCFKAL
jgi:hypothetical protein